MDNIKWLMAKTIRWKKFDMCKFFEYAVLAFFVKVCPKANLFCGCHKPVGKAGVVDSKKV